MKRNDGYKIALLIGIVLVIFYPVFFSEYAYTDELVGLWQFGSKDSSHTLLQYGRYITEKLAAGLFGSISTIKELTRIRLFSLTGWVCCIPLWYYVIKKVVIKENLPEAMAFFAVLYLICCPSFAISIGWAACFELFLANTAGLLSGYLVYAGLKFKNDRIHISPLYFVVSVILGVISLFTYQNGFGCFLLPFLLPLISKSKLTRNILFGIGAYFFIYIIYYLLFKFSLIYNHIEGSERTGLHINVGNKLPYFLARPLSSAFHFTYLFNEKSVAGIIIYGLTAAVWFVFSFIQRNRQSLAEKLKYFLLVFCFLGLSYLPSLVVKENYASYRTLFAIDLGVFIIVSQTFLAAIKNYKIKNTAVLLVSILFVVNAWYNFNKQFLAPVSKEYLTVRKFMENNYKNNTDTFYFIRPQEDFFVKKYGITRAWDEFGVPSTFFNWTPEFLTKQIVFEKTRDRVMADRIVIKSWLGNEEFLRSGVIASPAILFVDIEKIMGVE